MRLNFTLLLIAFFGNAQVQTLATFDNYSEMRGIRTLNNGYIIYQAKDNKGNSQVFSTNSNNGTTKQLTNPCPTRSNTTFFSPFSGASSDSEDGIFSDGNYYYGILTSYTNCETMEGHNKKVFKTDGISISYSNQSNTTLGLYEFHGLTDALSIDSKPLIIGNSESIFSINPDNLQLEKIYSIPNSTSNIDLYYVGKVNQSLLFYSRNNKNISKYNSSNKNMETLINLPNYYNSIYPNATPSPDEYAYNPDNKYEANIGFLDGSMFFWVSFYTSDYGYITALWKTDGTTNGTKEVKRFIKNSQKTSKSVSFINYKNELYFRFNHNDEGGLWKTNGTDAGTVMVKNLLNSTGTEQPFTNLMSNIVVLNNQLYFLSKGNKTNYQLWKSDGTTNGTNEAFRVYNTDIFDNNLIYGNHIKSDGSKLYFFGKVFYQNEIITSDGSLQNTYSLGISPIDVGHSIANPVNLEHNNLYFPTIGYSDKRFLNKLDLSTAKAYLLNSVNINQRTITIKGDNFATANRIYFYENNSDLGTYIENFTKVDNTTLQFTLSQENANYLGNKNFKVAVATKEGTYLQRANESNNLSTNDVRTVKNKIYQTETHLIIEPDFETLDHKSISIYNISGQLILQQKILKNNKLEIPLTTFGKGIYIVKIDEKVTKFPIK